MSWSGVGLRERSCEVGRDCTGKSQRGQIRARSHCAAGRGWRVRWERAIACCVGRGRVLVGLLVRIKVVPGIREFARLSDRLGGYLVGAMYR